MGSEGTFYLGMLSALGSPDFYGDNFSFLKICAGAVTARRVSFI
jgi:hypothetical protein